MWRSSSEPGGAGPRGIQLMRACRLGNGSGVTKAVEWPESSGVAAMRSALRVALSRGALRSLAGGQQSRLLTPSPLVQQSPLASCIIGHLPSGQNVRFPSAINAIAKTEASLRNAIRKPV